MTAEEIVMGGYAAFGSGDMEALGKIYHPECKTTFHANHALGGEYIGFDDLANNMLARLNDAWPGFNLSVDKVVSDVETFPFLPREKRARRPTACTFSTPPKKLAPIPFASPFAFPFCPAFEKRSLIRRCRQPPGSKSFVVRR